MYRSLVVKMLEMLPRLGLAVDGQLCYSTQELAPDTILLLPAFSVFFTENTVGAKHRYPHVLSFCVSVDPHNFNKLSQSYEMHLGDV